MAATRNQVTPLKSSREWQDEQWRKWPSEADWPGSLDLYEAAAFRRVSPATIRRAIVKDRAGCASLRHQRLGRTGLRFAKADLQAFGLVPDRKAS